jgi:serine/threonine protein kinase/WD40 repeat protein
MVTSPSNSACPRCGQTVSSGWIGGLCPRCLSRTSLGALLAPTPAARPRLGDYELGEELGRGAMGAVYRARHVTLGQTVALKVVLTGEFASEAERRRFLAEAGQAARLDHPNIVRVLNYGEADGRQFYAMELVEGPTLAAASQRGEWPMNPAESPAAPGSHRHFAFLISQVARAVQHAHERGVLHRDLKPGNILLDADGTPHVADFGLATLLGGDGESQSDPATMAGSPLGTPAYMAPEQVRGDRTLTTASDLWSLGAILYELLAGRPPFTGSSAHDTYRKILEEEPPRLGESRLGTAGNTPSPVRDLEIIARKCLRKAPGERYPSAGALADDLDRWLQGEPILARPVTAPEQAWLWARRRPVVAALTAAVTLLLLLVAIGGPVVAFRLSRAERQERAANVAAQDQLFESLLAQARASRLTLEPGRREAGLKAVQTAAKIRVTPELRDEAVALLALADQGQPAGVSNLVFRGDAVALDADFQRLLQEEAGPSFALRRRRDDQEEFRWPTPTNSGYLAQRELSPDGSLLVLNYNRPRLVLVQLASREVIFDAADTWFGGFSPDGTRFAALRGNHTLSVHESTNGRPVAEHRFDQTARASLAFHPGGAPVLAVPVGPDLQLWNWATDQIVGTMAEGAEIRCAAWHGDLLATSLLGGEIRLLDLRRNRRLRLSGHLDTVEYLRFSPDGAWLASLEGNDGLAHWWDTQTGSPRLRSDRFSFRQFSRDGSQVLLSTPTTWAVAPVLRPHSYRATRLGGESLSGYSPDGRWLLGGGADGLEIWDAERRVPLAAQPLPGFVEGFVTDGGRELLACDHRRIVRFKLGSEQNRLALAAAETVFTAPDWRIEGFAVSPDGTQFAVAHDSQLTLVDPRAPDRFTHLTNASIPRSPTFSPDGKWLVAGTFHGRGLQIWELPAGTPGPVLNTGNVFTRFSPDGTRLLAATSAGLIVFETGTWKVLFKLPSEAASDLPGRAAWSANGRLLAYAHRQKTVLLLDTESWQTRLRLESPDPLPVNRIAFAPDGGQLVVSGAGRAEWWDLRNLRQELAGLGLPWDAPPAGITPETPRPDLARLEPLVRAPALPAGIRPPLIVPPRLAGTPATQLDLTLYYNARLDEDWHFTGGAGNSLGTVPTELVDSGGVKFDARGILQLASASLAAQRTGYQLAVTRLPVAQACRALHFLGACGYAGSESPGAQVGRYVVHYADGTQFEIPIRHGQDTGDWWGQAQAQPSAATATVAWEGPNPEGRPVRLFRQTWRNPKPDVRIDHLDFVSAKRSSAPFLLAITAE